MIEDDADEQERAEAEALARALEDKSAVGLVDQSTLDPSTLEAAAFLRTVAAHDTLSEARADAVHASLHAAVARHIKPKRARFVGWAAASLAAAAAIVLLYMAKPARHTVELPAPPPLLLAAQAALSRPDDAQGRATFEREMGAYRKRVLRRIEQAYPEAVGMLEPSKVR